MSAGLKYRCVNCGNSVQELYRRYSPTVLKLMECGHCQQVADKYIEYELVIIMIDLVLLNKQAYRHILYNSSFENHWKLAVVLLLTETYSEWASHKSIQSSFDDKTKEGRLNDLFEGERSFYFICLQSIIGSTMFVMFVFMVTYLRWVVRPQTKPSSFNFLILWKAIVLSSFGKFLLVPGLVWGVNSSETHTLFVMGYTFLSQLQVYSVVSDTSRLSAGGIILLGLATKYFTRQLLSDLRYLAYLLHTSDGLSEIRTFLTVCDELSVRRIVGERKIRQPATITVENVLRDNLADLRSMVAREYCIILMGYGKIHKFHHMANKLNASAPERDIRLFELLLRIAIRIVWIALQRRNLTIIEYEVYRILRTQEFNMATRRTRSSLILGTMPIEQRVLYGEKSVEIYRLLARSPAAVEMLNFYHDFRLLGTGFIHYDKKDERIQFLEAVYTAAERDLKKLHIPFGILGKPREDFDAMLVPLQVPEEDLDHENELCYKSLAISSLTYMTIESKTYENVKLPVGEDCMEDAVPSEFPGKGNFFNKSNLKEQERARLMWQAIKAKH